MSDELPSCPGGTEKLHSFNKEAVFQLRLKGGKITCLDQINNAHLDSREETFYVRSETLFLLNRVVIGLRQHGAIDVWYAICLSNIYCHLKCHQLFPSGEVKPWERHSSHYTKYKPILTNS